VFTKVVYFFIDERLLNLIAESDPITESVQRIVNEGQVPKLEQDENNEDVDGDIFALAKRVSVVLQQIRESHKKSSQKKQQR
jgi:hypothetical protein